MSQMHVQITRDSVSVTDQGPDHCEGCGCAA